MLNILIIFQMYSDFVKEFSSFINALTHVKTLAAEKARQSSDERKKEQERKRARMAEKKLST